MGNRPLRGIAAAVALTVVGGTMLAPAAVARADGPTWKTAFYDGFDSDFGRGGFAAYNAGRYMTYDGMRDTTGKGLYDTSRVLSAKGGVLTWNLRTENGQPLVAVISPWTAALQNLTSERVSFRFRVPNTVSGYKIAPLLWVKNNNWADGEIDFPETSELAPTSAYYAAVFSPNKGGTTPKPAITRRSSIPAAGSAWHTAVLTRTPTSVTMQLDGWSAIFTSNLPTVAMRFAFQVETKIEGGKPAAGTTGSVELDWLKIEVPDATGTASGAAVTGTTADTAQTTSRAATTAGRASSTSRGVTAKASAASSKRSSAAKTPSSRSTARPAASSPASTATLVSAPEAQKQADQTASTLSAAALEQASTPPGPGVWPAAGAIALFAGAAAALGLRGRQRRGGRPKSESAAAWAERPPTRAIRPPEVGR
jgi:hypothetical protein